MSKIPRSYQQVIALFVALLSLVLYAAVSVAEVLPSDLIETRYTDSVERDKHGNYVRSGRVTRAFQKIHPCPSTLKKTGKCPDYHINHDVPLACGGRDAVSNMTWQRISTKKLIDREEREIYALDPPMADTAACRNKLQEVMQ